MFEIRWKHARSLYSWYKRFVTCFVCGLYTKLKAASIYSVMCDLQWWMWKWHIKFPGKVIIVNLSLSAHRYQYIHMYLKLPQYNHRVSSWDVCWHNSKTKYHKSKLYSLWIIVIIQTNLRGHLELDNLFVIIFTGPEWKCGRWLLVNERFI